MTVTSGTSAMLAGAGIAYVEVDDSACIVHANEPFAELVRSVVRSAAAQRSAQSAASQSSVSQSSVAPASGAHVPTAQGRDELASTDGAATAFVGRPIADVLPLGGAELAALVTAVLAGAQPAPRLVRLSTSNGHPALAVLAAASPLAREGKAPPPGASRPDGALVATVAFVLTDATAVVAELDAVRRSEKQFRMMCEASPVAIFLTDPDFNTLYNNPANLSQMGFSLGDNVGLAWQRALHPDDRDRIARAIDETLRQGSSYEGENRYLRRDGSVVWVKVRATPVYDEGRLLGVMGMSEDITAEKRLEEELLQAQKLESVARLAGGVAHDFNNLLTVILGHSSMARPLAPEGSRLREDLSAIEEAATRATSLTRQLLTFARRHHFEPRLVEINELTADMGVILRRLLGNDVELVTLFEPDIGIVRIDPAQLEQVLSNLAANARDAMPDGGTFTIETSNVDVEPRGSSPEGVPPGKYVLIEVSDTGVGMPPDVLPHVFEPFFSSKAGGRGTGLGLPACYGIVTQAGGHIRIESRVGEGTTVRIFLPRVEESTERKPDLRLAPAADATTILLVEDEPRVRAMAARTLRGAGYRVLEANDGLEAMRVAGEAATIDLLVTDVVMPKLSGRALAEQLAQQRGDLHVLFVSGYTGDAFGEGLPSVKHAAFLSKPYVPTMLLSRVRAALEGRR